MNLIPTILCVATILLSSGVAFAGAPTVEIPEPSALSLMAAGVAVAAWMKSRNRS